jgi:hypothetical protein
MPSHVETSLLTSKPVFFQSHLWDRTLNNIGMFFSYPVHFPGKDIVSNFLPDSHWFILSVFSLISMSAVGDTLMEKTRSLPLKY